jgi:hypothetical protein
MRRLVVLCSLLVLALPLAAGASTRAIGDGTLSVNDLAEVRPGVSVSIRVTQQAGLIGRCDQCSFRLDDIRPNDLTIAAPLVTGAETVKDIDGDGEEEFFSGRDIRWKIVGGGYVLKIRQGRDIDLSVVGKARVRIRGVDGRYSRDGGADKPVPLDSAIFWLGTPPPPPPSSTTP